MKPRYYFLGALFLAQLVSSFFVVEARAATLCYKEISDSGDGDIITNGNALIVGCYPVAAGQKCKIDEKQYEAPSCQLLSQTIIEDYTKKIKAPTVEVKIETPVQPQGKNCKDPGGCDVELANPLQSNITDVKQFIPITIKTIFGLLGALTLLMLVWGGFQWLTSAGNSEKVSEGTETMKWAILGVVLVFASYVLVDRVFSLVLGK